MMTAAPWLLAILLILIAGLILLLYYFIGEVQRARHEVTNTRRSHLVSTNNLRIELSAQKDRLASAIKSYSQEIERLHILAESLKNKNDGLLAIQNEVAAFYPSLAEAIADFTALELEVIARSLETKSWPAKTAAEQVRSAKREKRDAEKRFRILKYQLSYYESTFPWLIDIAGRSYKDLLMELETSTRSHHNYDNSGAPDRVRQWLEPREFDRLSSHERSDLALERWRRSRRSSWEAGRDYERAIGYAYETDGHLVEYHGAINGFEDMGRDLIARKNGKTKIVQCKYWHQERTIHEKHIFQIYGSALEYACKISNSTAQEVNLNNSNVTPVLVTSTCTSDTAKRAAMLIGVEIRENIPWEDYPQIKCNINQSTGEKIYHLPFDQQYDVTKINPIKGEFYASTAKEAEMKGFRRALRHYQT